MPKVLVDESILYGLIQDSLLLDYLESLGVDNWPYYCHPQNLEELTKQTLEEIKHG